MTAPTGGDGAAVISDTGLDGTSLSDLTALSYSTYDAVTTGRSSPTLRWISLTTSPPAEPDTMLCSSSPHTRRTHQAILAARLRMNKQS